MSGVCAIWDRLKTRVGVEEAGRVRLEPARDDLTVKFIISGTTSVMGLERRKAAKRPSKQEGMGAIGTTKQGSEKVDEYRGW